MRGYSISIFLLMFLVMFSVPVMAEMKTIHSGWHEYKDIFTVQEKVVDIRLAESSPDFDTIRVRVDNETAFVEYHECEEVNLFLVCYENQSFKVKESTISDNDNVVPGLKINISYYDLSSDMVITTTFGAFSVYQTKQVNITFKNKKEQWIEFFKYDLTLPDGVTIVKSEDFTITGQNKLSYSGALPSLQSKTVSFTITSGTAGTKKVNYNVTIESQGLSKSTKGTYDFSVTSPYTITLSMAPSNVNVLDTSRFVINLKNTGTEEMELLNLTIKGPEDLFYTAGRGLEYQTMGSFYQSSKETIYAGRDREYYIIITPQYLGKYNFSVNAEMKYNGGIIRGNKNSSLVASANGLVPVTYLSKDAVLSGSTVELVYEISNTNADTTFSDISVDIQGVFFSEQIALDKLNTNEQITLLRKTFTVPYVDKDTTYKVNTTTTYLTQAGQKKQISSIKNLKITSNGTLLSLSHKLSDKEIYEGDELIVELSVRNMKEEIFQVSASDAVPAGAQKMGGINNRSFTLTGQTTDSAYIYKLIVPENSNVGQLNITSVVTIPSKGYNKTITTPIKVKANLSSATILKNITTGNTDNKTINESDIDVKQGSNGRPAKQDGFFKKIVRGISDFFENVFS